MGLKQGWFAGADGGGNLFYGDVTKYNFFPKWGDIKASYGNGFSIFGGKKFVFGLAAEAQIFKGTLKGEKQADRLYPRYFNADIMGYFVSAKYNLSQMVFREKQDRKFFNRLTVYATVGGGQVFFRSRLYKQAYNGFWYLEKTNSYETVGVDSAGINSAGGLVIDKKKNSSAIIIPVGGKIHFKLNSRTDVVFDLTYTTAFTDKLDSWERSWTHKDRYLYTGLGLCFNFVPQDAEDVPDSQRILRPKDEKSSSTSSSDSGDENDAYDGSLTSKKSSKKSSKKKSKDVDKDLELRMKIYEMQLKLFEMQYLTQ